MDGRTRYAKACRILKEIEGEKLHLNKLRRRIMIEVGTSEETITEFLKLMRELEMIVERDNFIFEVISAKAKL